LKEDKKWMQYTPKIDATKGYGVLKEEQKWMQYTPAKWI